MQCLKCRAYRPLLIATACALFAVPAYAGPAPGLLGYEGRLLNADGTADTGIQSVTFRIYDAPTAGTLQWEETQQVGLTNGYFSVQLGSVASLPGSLFDGSTKYLEVVPNVDGGNPLAPRQLINSVAYALTCTQAYGVSGGTVNASQVQIAGNTVIDSTGKVTAASLNIGGGTVVDSNGQIDWSHLKNISVASATDGGFLAAADWSTFNSKLGAVVHDSSLVGNGTTASPLRVAGNSGSPSGPLGVADGGTGDTSLNAHGLLVGEGTGAVSVTAAGDAGQLLIGQGATADPSFQTVGGDATLSSSGTLSVVGLDSIPFSSTPSNGQVLQVSGGQWIPTAASVTVTAGSGLSGGGPVVLGGSATLSISSGGVTNAMLATGAVNLAAYDVAGTLPVANGGTNATTASGALSNLGGASLSQANTFTTGVQTIQTGAATTKGLVVQGAASQSANLEEWQNSTGTAVASVGPTGLFTGSFAGNGSALTNLSAGNLSSGTVPLGQLSGITGAQLSATAGITNGQLANSSVTVTAGSGLSGGGPVALGSSVTLRNTGVTSLTGAGGVTVSAGSGAVTLGSTSGGDLSGALNSAKVVGINGAAINGSATAGQILELNASNQWVPTTPNWLSAVSVSASSPLTGNGTSGSPLGLGTVGIANGGTGSTIQNFVDLSTTQLIYGTKIFENPLWFSTTGSSLGGDQGGAIELGAEDTAANATGNRPYIDFHYGTGTIQDYNVRLQNDRDGELTFQSDLGLNGFFNVQSSAFFAGNVQFSSTGAQLTADQGGSLVLGANALTANTAGNTPYLDFHYGTGTVETEDTRLINDAPGQLTFVGVNGAAGTFHIAGTAVVSGNVGAGSLTASSANVTGNVGAGSFSGGSALITSGNVSLRLAGSGVIVKSPNGSICKQIGIDNAGALILTTAACP